MKVQEDLVYNKSGEHLYGFMNLGEVNDQLQLLKKRALCSSESTPCDKIASHMLTIMVRGIFVRMDFSFASFSTQGMRYHFDLLINLI